MSIGPAEILVILIVALLVFGPERLPQVGRQVGAAVRELRKMQDTVRGELDMVLHPEHGTRPGDAPYEPGDHPTYPTYDDDSGNVTPVEIEPAAPDDGTDADARFHGPPDSFI